MRSFKKQPVFLLLYIVLLALTAEAILKVYFMLPLPCSKIINMVIEKRKKENLMADLLVPFEWNKGLIYTPKKNIRHFERFFDWALIKDDFEVSINADGFRFPPAHTLSSIKNSTKRKIICLGESWTMGWGVDAAWSYPSQLQEMAGEQIPERNYEVFNLGMITYTSFQGVKILQKISPMINTGDIVIIGYNANDPRNGLLFRSVYRENVFLEERQFYETVFNTGGGFTAVKILKIITNSLCKRQSSGRRSFWDYIPRVPYADYYSNYVKMIKMIKSKGATPILLYHGLFKEEDYTVEALSRIAQKQRVSLVNVHDILQQMAKEEAKHVETKYPWLKPSREGAQTDTKLLTILFRVVPSGGKAPFKNEDIQRVELVFFNAPAEEGGARIIPLNDEGLGGDERAGDGVWSLAFSYKPDIRSLKVAPRYKDGLFQGEHDLHCFFYFRVIDKKKGNIYREFRYPDMIPIWVNLWRGICVGEILTAAHPLSYKSLSSQTPRFYKEIITPVYSFGKQAMRSEFIHPTLKGYRLFAERIFEAIKKIP